MGKNNKKLTTNTFIEIAIAIHGDKYDYSEVIYTTSSAKVKIICKVHGAFYQIATNHISKKCGCPKCGTDGNKVSNEEFRERARLIHGNKYDYSLTEYTHSKNKLSIICPVEGHGIFEQIAYQHLRGHGCIKCFADKNRMAKVKSLDTFIDEANTIHNNIYDYSKSIYVSSYINIEIICKKHGSFYQKPSNHLLGSICPKCSREQHPLKIMTTKDEFIAASNKKHNNKYDYSEMEYNGLNEDVKIICPIHGTFLQKGYLHLRAGCHKCAHVISKPEIEWLDYMNIPEEYRQQKRKINGKRYRLDACIDSTRTIYEFYGDWWHGNPDIYDPEDENGANHKLFGDLYKKTISKEEELRSCGYNVISIWENDWNQIKKSLQ